MTTNRRPAAEDIPEHEQWRLIEESGVLKKVKEAEREESPLLAEEIADAFLLITPISFLLLMMEMYAKYALLRALCDMCIRSLIHYQYHQTPTLQALIDRMVPGVPSTSRILC